MLLKALCLHSVCTLLALCIGDTEELYGRKKSFFVWDGVVWERRKSEKTTSFQLFFVSLQAFQKQSNIHGI